MLAEKSASKIRKRIRKPRREKPKQYEKEAVVLIVKLRVCNADVTHHYER